MLLHLMLVVVAAVLVRLLSPEEMAEVVEALLVGVAVAAALLDTPETVELVVMLVETGPLVQVAVVAEEALLQKLAPKPLAALVAAA